VQAYSPGSNESDLGDEECEPGSVDEAVDDEKELGCRVQSCPAWEPAAEEEGAGETEENRSGDERGEAEIKTMLKSPRAPRGWRLEISCRGIRRRGQCNPRPSAVGIQSDANSLAV